ncbi:MAG: hypothetical protein V7L26_15065 [Nostoc sp.]|uniref:hypothetical protein n=1 Tax=Nostoc sp. TaxID=1180 RepID=UPI002FF32623
MANIPFLVPYSVGWCGKTYLPGLQSIPQDLAVALGWKPDAVKAELPNAGKTVTK